MLDQVGQPEVQKKGSFGTNYSMPLAKSTDLIDNKDPVDQTEQIDVKIEIQQTNGPTENKVSRGAFSSSF